MSRLLLDTHALLWFQGADRRLPPRVRSRLESADELVVSAASTWEVAIKVSRGLLELPVSLDAYVTSVVARYSSLPVLPLHTVKVAALPWHHRDPFDRMLAAQALSEGLHFVTKDRVFRDYGVSTIW